MLQNLLRRAISRESFVADLHSVEEPFRVALQNRCNLFAYIPAWLTESVDDPAQMGFIDAEHSRQTILPNPSGVNSEFKVRIDIPIKAHDRITL